ncbi:MAG: universal stress protein [Myxococcaceae bacterium]|nr:universal stress protein [Myxococcaceae bacterium]MCI0669612.1 universal stress protein [Myxococcaceae bacterium]
MSRYLVAIDNSQPSLDAVDLAARLASKTGASLTLLHVVTPIDTPPGLPAEFATDLTASLRKEGQDLLDNVAARVKPKGVSVNTQLELGDPARRIADLARQADVEMVVMGSHGRNAMARMLMGSVATKVVHLCEKPVLVVR